MATPVNSIPADPDAGQTLSATSLDLSSTQASATLSAPRLSFTGGRTLRIPNLPAGVTTSVNTGNRTLTLSLDPETAKTGATSLTLQYVTPAGQVLLSAPFTLTVTLPVTPTPTPPVAGPVAPPAPTDPDAGQEFSGGSVTLSTAHPSATITATNLSLTFSRTLKITNLPPGVTASVNTISKTATLALDPTTAVSGTTTLNVHYVNADGTVRLSAPYTLSVSVPAPAPAPIPTPPAPVDPDAGQVLTGGNLVLSPTQLAATITAQHLSFTSGRSLTLSPLPTGVTASIDPTTKRATLTLDPAVATSGTSTLTVQYVNADGTVRLTAPYTLTVTVPAPIPTPPPTPAPAPSPAPAPAPATTSPYKFTLVFAPGTDPRVQTAAQMAAAHWEKIITSSIGTRHINLAAQDCGNIQAYNQTTQDMVIFIGTTTMDGPGGTLARSGPCLISGNTATGMPVAAQLIFDGSDIDSLASQLPGIATHELGHSLGIGTLWKMRGLVQGTGTTDPRYTGINALHEYAALGGSLGTIPVENTGGTGTAGGHWREKTFGNELMTGYLNPGSNPLSRMSIGTLQDLGYTVDYAAADTYSTKTMNTLSIDAHFEDHFERPEIKFVP